MAHNVTGGNDGQTMPTGTNRRTNEHKERETSMNGGNDRKSGNRGNGGNDRNDRKSGNSGNDRNDRNDGNDRNSGLTMAEMSMKYPLGTVIEDGEVRGYRRTENESALYLADGKWKPV